MEYFADAKVISNVRGHVRIDVPRLYRSQSVAAAIETHLETCRGVRGARANPVTGRVLLTLDPAMETERLLAGLGVRPPAGKRPLTAAL
ncbi:MAG TPA: hypothetical protein VN089_27460, partial [Duganella sp.]|nr:hypothetical protein [Duganella sp.]